MMNDPGAVSIYSDKQDEDECRSALLNGRLPVAVYGLGKMGLPLAAVYADVTGNVVGADIDPDIVDTVNRGECHIKSEPGLPNLVRDLTDCGALHAVSDPVDAARDASVHVIIVPTLIDENNCPDLSILEAVSQDIGAELSPGELVIVESTVPPGTCRSVVVETLEDSSDLSLGEFGVAFCPERTSSGRALEDIRGAYPKVVGGADAESTAAARIIYEEINSSGVVPTSDITVAEAVKVFEGVYRDVNIALANELAKFADEIGIDVNEAIEVANTLPFADLHTPGPGVGGHCIPYYPYFMIKPFETSAPLIQTARDVNDEMPSFTIRKLVEEFNAEGRDITGATVMILGLAYRAGVNEIRATPALPIAKGLTERGANVRLVDPIIDDFEPFDGTPTSIDEIYDCGLDAAVLVTAHPEFDAIDWNRFEPLIVLDSRQALELGDTEHRVYTIGSGHLTFNETE